MQLKKILVSLLVVVLMLSATILVAADDSAADEAALGLAVEVSSAVESGDENLLVKAGETIEVSITITNNPGVSVMQFYVNFNPEYLEPVVDANGKVVVEGDVFNFRPTASQDGVMLKTDKIYFISDTSKIQTNVTKTGLVAKLSFKVKAGAHTANDANAGLNITDIQAFNSKYAAVEYTLDAKNVVIHTPGEATVVAPTCTEGGYTSAKCTACDYVHTYDFTDATGHTEVDVEAVAPTCTEAGKTAGKQCSVCKEFTVPQEEVPATGHGAAEVVEGTPATCTEAGKTAGTKCTVCGEFINAQTEIPATGHKEVSIAAVAPTCTAEGLTEGKQCSTCGEILVAQSTVPATGHNETVISGVAATCTSIGLTEGKKCSVCGVVTVDQTVIPATGHTEEAFGNNGIKCSVCGLVIQPEEVVNLTWLWVIIAVVVVAALAAVIYFFVIKKKK